MSGIVGILNLDGAPVDRRLLQRLTTFMTFRGPNDQRIWMNGNVGFGHTLLRTTIESEHQPFTLDGQVWIVADARVDARGDLVAKLVARGENVELSSTDVELLLRAYHVWGEECVDHLLGDFAFAVWDGQKRSLFCARDHLGVKPFFYSHIGQTVIFSNTLDCIRQHPAVSDKLNDLAIADFLLFALNQEPGTTSFNDIQRIPPGHRTVWSVNDMNSGRYWKLPIDEPVFFKRTDDYVERFQELLRLSVSDRIRGKDVGILMSGGLDSPLLAATAVAQLGEPSNVRAFSIVFEKVPDGERQYADAAARHLGIPIHFWVRDGGNRLGDWQTSAQTPEPNPAPWDAADEAQYTAQLPALSRVFFYGEGPDNALLYEWQPFLSHLRRTLNLGELIRSAVRHASLQRRVPLLPSLPRLWKHKRLEPQQESFPRWLNQDLVERLGLQDRWRIVNNPGPVLHPIRPRAYRSLTSVLWPAMFESSDATVTSQPLDFYHPYLDLRLLRYMLSVPAVPWCRVKMLEREAARGLLPECVRTRPKTPLSNDSWFSRPTENRLSSSHNIHDKLWGYVTPSILSHKSEGSPYASLESRAFALNHWMRGVSVCNNQRL
jgi:asparagine synthase (glutamine-hydrolysing)